jgi:hypothetical protein
VWLAAEASSFTWVAISQDNKRRPNPGKIDRCR